MAWEVGYELDDTILVANLDPSEHFILQVGGILCIRDASVSSLE
jgi:hypothetical protein